MKKVIRSLVMLAIFSLVLPQVTFGNDYISDKKVWVHGDKPACFSLDNIGEYDDKYIAIYDYSKDIGTSLGRPWTNIEQGKCYEVDFTTEQVFVFERPLNPEISRVLDSKELHDSGVNLSDIIKTCDPEPDYETLCYEDGVSVFRPFDGYYGLGGTAYGSAQSLNMSLDSLLPIKYTVGEGYTGYSSIFGSPHNPTGPISKDERYVFSKDLFDNLALSLREMVEQCDSRMRIEEKFSLVDANDSSPMRLQRTSKIWRLSSGEDILFDYDTTPLQNIELLGCTSNLHSFLRENMEDIQTIEGALEGLYADHSKSDDDPYTAGVVKLRDESEYTYLKEFSDSPTVPTIDISGVPRVEVAPAKEVEKVVSVEPEIVLDKESETTKEGVVEDTIPPITNETEMAVESEQSTKNLLYFVLLPILGIGGLVWLILRSRKNTFN